MTRRYWNSMAMGGILTLLGWWFVWPEKGAGQESQGDVSSEKLISTSSKSGRFSGFKSEMTWQEKWEGIESLNSVPVETLIERLDQVFTSPHESVPMDSPDEMTLEMNALLIALARSDPREAVAWIDQRWPEGKDRFDFFAERMRAWRLVAAEWASKNSLEFVEFMIQVKSVQNHRFTLHDGELYELLLHGAPAGWMQIYFRDEISMPIDEARFLARLKVRDDFEAALGAWENFPDEEREAFEKKIAGYPEALAKLERGWFEERSDPQKNKLGKMMIEKWKEVDLEGYRESGFSDE